MIEKIHIIFKGEKEPEKKFDLFEIFKNLQNRPSMK